MYNFNLYNVYFVVKLTQRWPQREPLDLTFLYARALEIRSLSKSYGGKTLRLIEIKSSLQYFERKFYVPKSSIKVFEHLFYSIAYIFSP